MPSLFLGNFDCEYEWAGRESGRGARFSSGLLPAWLAVTGADDYVLIPPGWQAGGLAPLAAIGCPLPGFVDRVERLRGLPNLRLIPWGSTDSAWKLAADCGAAFDCADPRIARDVNSRSFRFALEGELGVAPAGSTRIDSSTDFVAAIRGFPSETGWVLKANFGMSGREAIRGRGPQPNEAQLQFLKSRLVSGPLILEPLLESLGEAGIQWQVPRDRPCELLGVTEQIVAGGCWRGSRFLAGTDESRWRGAVETTREAAERVRRVGYFGPLGFDAMWHEVREAGPMLRPLQDLNARFTMGRITLGWRRLAPPGWCVANLWLATDLSQPEWTARLSSLAADDPMASNSWLACPIPAGEAKRINVVLLAKDPPTLAALERRVTAWSTATGAE